MVQSPQLIKPVPPTLPSLTKQDSPISTQRISNKQKFKTSLIWLFNTKDPENLTQEQKDTIVSILNLATVTTTYTATDGNVADTVNGSEIGKGRLRIMLLKLYGILQILGWEQLHLDIIFQKEIMALQ